MSVYVQTNRPFRVETALGADVLLLDGFAGEEGVSTPFRFTLDLVSEDDAIDAIIAPTVVIRIVDQHSEPEV